MPLGHVLYTFGIVYCIACIAGSLWLGFTSPDMTGQRLLLTYWQWYLSSTVGLLGGAYLLSWYNNRNK